MIEITIITLLALFGGLSVVFALMLGVHWGRKRELGLVPYAFYLIVINGALGVAFSGRDLSLADDMMMGMAKHPLPVWFGRLASLFILFACGERILTRLMARDGSPTAPKFLMLALWTFFITNIFCPAVFGRNPMMGHELLFMVLICQACLLFNTKEVQLALVSLRNALLLLLVMSAAVLAIKPHLVLATHYQGLIPHLPVRYAGLTQHANGFAPLVLVFLLTLWRTPFQMKWLNRGAWALGLVSMLLAQSKTTWIAAMIAAACIAYWSYRDEIEARLTSVREPQLPVLLILVVMLGAAMACGLYMFTDVDAKVVRYFASREGSDLMSLTGRDRIWEVAKEEWQKNPVFGYGLDLFNLRFRIAIHFPGAVHAHNQFFQSAATAGTVGALGLVFYWLTLFYYVLRTVRASGGLSLVLFILLMAGSISEIPFAMNSYGVEKLPHMLLLVLLAAYSRSPARPAAPALAGAGSLRAATLAPGM